MPAFPPRRPFCVHDSLARPLARRLVVCVLTAVVLLAAAPATLGAATLADLSLADALPLDAGRHTLYEPSASRLVAVELDPLVHDADRLGVEAWADDGRRLAVDYLGAIDGAGGHQVAHWISAVVVEGQGAGNHVFLVRTLDGSALDMHTVAALHDPAMWGLPVKVNDEEQPKPDDDTGDILLAGKRGSGEQLDDEDQPKPDDDTGDILLAGKRWVGEQLDDEDQPKPDDDTGDILLGAGEGCYVGQSWICAREQSEEPGLEEDSLLEPRSWRLRIETARVVRIARTGTVLEVFDHRGLRVAPEPSTDSGLFALPRGEYLVRMIP